MTILEARVVLPRQHGRVPIDDREGQVAVVEGGCRFLARAAFVSYYGRASHGEITNQSPRAGAVGCSDSAL